MILLINRGTRRVRGMLAALVRPLGRPLGRSRGERRGMATSDRLWRDSGRAVYVGSGWVGFYILENGSKEAFKNKMWKMFLVFVCTLTHCSFVLLGWREVMNMSE
jgi:hypothetical protein